MYSDHDKVVSIMENKDNADIVANIINNRGIKYVGSALTMASMATYHYNPEDEINCTNYKCVKYILECQHVDMAAISSMGTMAIHYIG